MMDFIEERVRARQPDYPPEQSAGGGNTYALSCRVVGWSPGYCVCLHKINAYERDGHLKSYPECDKGIGSKACLALELRAQERAAGKALFYVDRTLLREEMDKHFAETSPPLRPVTTKKSAPLPTGITPRAEKPAPAPVAAPKKEVDAFDDGGYAAAINAAIKEAQTAPAVAAPAPAPQKSEPKVVAPPPSTEKKGMSLLDIARIQAGKATKDQV